MTATVANMGDYRAVFILPATTGTSVFLASSGTPPRLAHQRCFTAAADAATYADTLAQRFGCKVLGTAGSRTEGGATA